MQMDNDKRWEAIYGNVITEGRRIKRKRNVMKFAGAASIIFIFSFFLYTGTINSGSEILMEKFPEDFAYNEDYVEIALIAQGVFFDDELGLLME